MAKVRDFFLATRTAKVLLGPTKGPLLGVGIRSYPAVLVTWVGQAGGAVSDFGRLGSQQYFGPQPRANLYGVRLGQERIPVPHSGPLGALRGSQATRWAKKKSPHWAAIWPHVPYVCTDTPNRSPRTHSRPRLWDPASGAVLPPMGDSRPGLRPTPGPSRPRRGTESACFRPLLH